MKASDPKYNTFWRRLWAEIVDATCLVFFILLAFLIFKPYGIESRIFFIAAINIVWYSYRIYMHYNFGQTIGKKVTNIIVLDEKEEKLISVDQALYRESIGIVLDLVAIIFIVVTFDEKREWEQILSRQHSDYSMRIVQLSRFIWLLIQFLSMITNPKSRSVSDFMAHSVVILKEYDSPQPSSEIQDT